MGERSEGAKDADVAAQRVELTLAAAGVGRFQAVHGYSILVPWGVNQRYDPVLDLDGEFVRAQCKTGWLRNGVVIFSTRSVQCNTGRMVVRGYRGDADLFLVHCPNTGGVYCVPVDEAPTQYMRLRVEPTLNGQDGNVNWARDYELPE